MPARKRRGAILTSLLLIALVCFTVRAAFVQAFGPASARRKARLFAEGADDGPVAAVVADKPLEEGTAADATSAEPVESPASPAEAAQAEAAVVAPAEAAAPAAPARILPVFQEKNVTFLTDQKKLAGVMVGIFSSGERAVDLILRDPRASAKAKMAYSVALLPNTFRAAAQILVRRRDRTLRMRVLQHFRPTPDENPEVMRISANANITRLASAILSKFVDVAGNNLQRTVQLQMQGPACAALALQAIEQASQKAHREFTIHPFFVKEYGLGETDAEGRPIYYPLTAQPEGVPEDRNFNVELHITIVAT